MTQQVINIGSVANDGTGDAIRNAFDKSNQNFTELYGVIATLGTAAFVATSTFALASHTHPASAISDSTAAGRALLTAADATAQRSALGLGTAATQASTAFAAASHTHAIADVTNLQTTLDGKAASTHTHAIADVTGLQTALDGKAASSHTHSASQISDSTAAGRALLTAADAAAQRSALGLGTAATSASSAFAAATHTHAAADISDSTSAGRALLTAADASAQRTSLGLVIGTDVQAYDADLAALAALSGTNTIYYRSGANTWSAVTIGVGLSFTGGTLANTGGGGGGGLTDGDYGDITVSGTGTVMNIDAGAVGSTELGGDITTAGKALLTAADAAAQRTALGLGGAAVRADSFFVQSSAVSAFALTFLDDADAAAVRTTLGLGTAATQASSAFAAATHTHAAADISDSTSAGRALLTAADAAAQRTALGLGGAALRADSFFVQSSAVSAFALTLLDDADAAAVRTTLGLGTAATQASTAFAAATHTHAAADISDSTSAGRALLTAADAAAQRTALGLGTAATQASTAFAAASHTHAIADVTGLQTALDGKAATNHTHTSSIVVVFDGGGSAIAANSKCDIEIPFSGTITSATLVADQTGSMVVDVWKDTYANYPPTSADSIAASAKPTLSSASKSQDTTLTGWTTSVSAGDLLRFNVDSASTITRATLSLRITRT